MRPNQDSPLTTALVKQHVQRHAGGWDVGMLDIGQDHILCHLFENGIFERGLVFKGGTALRKCRSGTNGRFSTDLDFAVKDRQLINDVFAMIDGHSCHGFSFTLENQNHETGKADVIVYPPFKESIRVSTPHLRVASKLDISPRMPWMSSEELTFVRSPVHRALNHTLPTVPIVGLEEAVAENSPDIHVTQYLEISTISGGMEVMFSSMKL